MALTDCVTGQKECLCSQCWRPVSKGVTLLTIIVDYYLPVKGPKSYIQYSPKIMHAQELLFASASRATSCACVLRTARTSLRLESFNSKNFFAVRLSKRKNFQECPTEPILKIAAPQAKLCWLANLRMRQNPGWDGNISSRKFAGNFVKYWSVAGKICFLLAGRRKKQTTTQINTRR